MEDCHGLPYRASDALIKKLIMATQGDDGELNFDAGWITDTWIIPLYHPAAGLHSPEQQPLIYWDFMQFGKYVSGRLEPRTPSDNYPDPDYYEPRGEVSLVRSLPLAIDTEGLAGRVWGLSYSQIPGSAGVVRMTSKRALLSMKRQLYG